MKTSNLNQGLLNFKVKNKDGNCIPYPKLFFCYEIIHHSHVNLIFWPNWTGGDILEGTNVIFPIFFPHQIKRVKSALVTMLWQVTLGK